MDVLDSAEAAALTVREQAAAVINSSKIDLNYKLGVFTVIGTSELRVETYLQTCSCSAQSA